MSQTKLANKAGALAILLAILLRFASTVSWGSDIPIFAQPEVAAFLVRSETGRRPPPTVASTASRPTLSATAKPTITTTLPITTTKPLPPETVKATFSPTDVRHVQLTYSCDYRPDLQALLTKKLTWELSGQPSVLILHSHGTESYTQTPDTAYKEYGGNFRTNDDHYNLISIGDELTRLLEQAGIGVIHDRTPYDKDDYQNAYSNARKAIQSHLTQHPTIRLVLDLHRDAAAYADGTQWATSATVNGQKSAQLMFVVGTDASGNSHPNWQENLSVAQKLHVLLEKNTPGITRPIHLRAQRFNHDLSPAAMIVEVGSAGNTHPQAMTAIPLLADAIIALQHGTS